MRVKIIEADTLREKHVMKNVTDVVVTGNTLCVWQGFDKVATIESASETIYHIKDDEDVING